MAEDTIRCRVYLLNLNVYPPRKYRVVLGLLKQEGVELEQETSRMREKMTLPTKILVALDGSDTSLKACEYAGLIAAVAHARVGLVHAILVPEETGSTLYNSLSSKARGFLDSAAEGLRSHGVPVDWNIVRTDKSVVGAVIDYADGWGADLVVLGTRGVSGYGKMVLGSVAAGVVSFAHCPVLAVR